MAWRALALGTDQGEPAMTRFATLFLALFGTMTLVSACETIQGAGQDIENAGEAIQDESADVQADM